MTRRGKTHVLRRAGRDSALCAGHVGAPAAPAEKRWPPSGICAGSRKWLWTTSVRLRGARPRGLKETEGKAAMSGPDPAPPPPPPASAAIRAGTGHPMPPPGVLAPRLKPRPWPARARSLAHVCSAWPGLAAGWGWGSAAPEYAVPAAWEGAGFAGREMPPQPEPRRPRGRRYRGSGPAAPSPLCGPAAGK